MRLRRQGGFLLARVHRESKRCFARLLRRHGISLTAVQGRVLFPLWREGVLPIHELGRRTGLGKSTLTGLIDRLERDGYVRRLRSAQDRRVVEVEAVLKDRGGLEAVRRASAEMAALFYAGFSEAEVERFEQTLERVLANLLEDGRQAYGRSAAGTRLRRRGPR